ncbi:hypothetical protein [Pacificibacter sp. AS14]|uniref:hypothetical protein n=1 Tax=Pacificibacter sp. AS14 TaxID=3135785 RepID=UPI00317544A8
MMKWVILLGSFWASNALACGDTGLPMMSSDNDAPRVELIIEDMPLSQPFSMEIKFCDDADIQSVSVDAIMPAHQHGMNYTPVIVDLGDGSFRVDGMLFHMLGVWEIQVGLVQDKGVTRYTQTTTLK